ncbi:RagB/SusD family nutrient uptake outer membrane protein [Solitalea koreensis]|uniref:Starch-binding associating with outer membrane n=1 Tax=Solitalea koreensis TaxID=543615 RepID=A0A521AVC6_9SPHI|nr:RagB/SusD family nutrient uptake outer membrane protein [Solitalea koreensis]SMO38769.1 Starch-binding associating with outer membrane [Solitalea koreensis]
MKNLKYIVVTLLLGSLTNTSCTDYLTVNPKTEMRQDKLFSTEKGFKDALNGIYIQMKGTEAYGGAMTMTTIEHAVSNWDVAPGSAEEQLNLFNYTDTKVENSWSSIYGTEYTIIAGINVILSHIDEKREVFTSPGTYETIKAECLALRAYCHLDILRLYGPVASDVSAGNKLAYVIDLSGTRASFFQEALLKDLVEAEGLVKAIDPIVTNVTTKDTYFDSRNLKMNYYAIKALQARAYLWFNNKEKAYECAKIVIDAKNSNGTPKFRLGVSADMSTNKDYTLTSEHIFALYDFNLASKYTSLFQNGTLKKGGNNNAVINLQLYGNTGTDMRELNLWQLIKENYVLRKYEGGKQIPLLRLSEMYMIAIETAPPADAQALWTAFRSARGIGNRAPITLPVDPALLQTELIKEYRKEFYAEGQSFFACKRLNLKTNVLFVPTEAKINYLIPLPKTETINLN